MSKALLFKIEIAFSITFAGLNGIVSKKILRFSSFAKSKMSLTKNRMLLALLFKAFKWPFWEAFSSVRSKISEAEITAERGVLISWVVYARKSSFSFFNSSFCVLAKRRLLASSDLVLNAK